MAVEWYVIRTHYAQEERADLELRNQGWQTKLPLARYEYRQRNGNLIERIRPLFRSYLFVAFDVYEDRWGPIVNTKGVVTFVGYRLGMDRPPAVPEKDMQELNDRLSQCGGVLPLGISRPMEIEPGMMVRILFGPFRDQTALAQARCGSRVEVLLRFAGAYRPVKLHRDNLVPAI